MRSVGPPHTWVIARLDAWSAGLLDEEQAARIEEHLAGCASCRQLADPREDLGAEAIAGAGHLPPPLIARWGHLDLDPLERQMAERHLATCARCRREIEMAAAARHRLARRPGGFAIGGWVAAAAVMVLGLAILRPNERPPLQEAPLPGTTPAPEPLAPDLRTRSDTPPARAGPVVRLMSPERGTGGESIQVVRWQSGDSAPRLVIEPLMDVAPEAIVTIRIATADGRELARLDVPHAEAVNPAHGAALELEPWMIEIADPLTVSASGPRTGSGEIESTDYRIRIQH